MKKKLPIGIEDFKEIIEKDCYYVDKTLFIKELLDNSSKVRLFTRPRRFGKTLALSMLRYYFEKEITVEGKAGYNSRLFRGLKILDAGESYLSHMGQYPVISLSLKSAKQPSFEMAYASILDELALEFDRHKSVLYSDELSEDEKALFERFIKRQASEWENFKALKFLSKCLQKVYQKNAIILLDEYDVPLENAWFRGFYEQMTFFIRSLFESALKTNPSLEFAVITGCLRISKESIFTGLNNLEIISVLSSRYSEHFGFTVPEVGNMLHFYDIEEKKEEVKRWYDGYFFGNTEVYNPWSMINYVNEAVSNINSLPRPYWANTSSNGIIRDMIEHADNSIKLELENLIAGECIEKPVHEDITYEEIHESEDNLWNFLFFTGYLKKVREHMQADTVYITLAFPNAEVKYIYRNTIMEWFDGQIRLKDFSALYKALLNKDIALIERELSKSLMETVSFFDYKEDYYHGFTAGLVKMMEGYIVESNRESGMGRSDIIIRSAPYEGIAIIIETKVADSYGQLEEKAVQALAQIEEKQYDAGLRSEGYHTFIKYGIAFFKKLCRVHVNE